MSATPIPSLSEQIAARLGRPLTSSESGRAVVLEAEARALARAYLARPVETDDAAATVDLVIVRMVARALSVPDGETGVADYSESLGSYSHSRRFVDGSRDGGAWLSDSDRLILSAIGGAARSGAAVSVELVSERYA